MTQQLTVAMYALISNQWTCTTDRLYLQLIAPGFGADGGDITELGPGLVSFDGQVGCDVEPGRRDVASTIRGGGEGGSAVKFHSLGIKTSAGKVRGVAVYHLRKHALDVVDDLWLVIQVDVAVQVLLVLHSISLASNILLIPIRHYDLAYLFVVHFIRVPHNTQHVLQRTRILQILIHSYHPLYNLDNLADPRCDTALPEVTPHSHVLTHQVGIAQAYGPIMADVQCVAADPHIHTQGLVIGEGVAGTQQDGPELVLLELQPQPTALLELFKQGPGRVLQPDSDTVLEAAQSGLLVDEVDHLGRVLGLALQSRLEVLAEGSLRGVQAALGATLNQQVLMLAAAASVVLAQRGGLQEEQAGRRRAGDARPSLLCAHFQYQFLSYFSAIYNCLQTK